MFGRAHVVPHSCRAGDAASPHAALRSDANGPLSERGPHLRSRTRLHAGVPQVHIRRSRARPSGPVTPPIADGRPHQAGDAGHRRDQHPLLPHLTAHHQQHTVPGGGALAQHALRRARGAPRRARLDDLDRRPPRRGEALPRDVERVADDIRRTSLCIHRGRSILPRPAPARITPR
jgi:hypothetical protein